MELPRYTKVFLYAFGNVLPKFISFAAVPLFSFFLTKKEMGIYDLLLGSVSLLVPIITFPNWRCVLSLDFQT